MKKHILLLFAFGFAGIATKAQFVADANGHFSLLNTGIGQNSQVNRALSVFTNTNTHSLELINQVNSASPVYGILSNVNAGGTGAAYGLNATVTGGTGTRYGVFASAPGGTHWAGYFDGRGYFNEEVGFGNPTPGAKLDVSTPSTYNGFAGLRIIGSPNYSGANYTNHIVVFAPSFPTPVFHFNVSKSGATGFGVNNQDAVGADLAKLKIHILNTANYQALKLQNSSNANVFFVPKLGTAGYNWLSQNNDAGIFWSHNNVSDATNGLVIAPRNGSAWAGMRIGADGKVSIGVNPTTLNGNYRLYVANGILTEKVKVALQNGSDWFDWVFDPGYKRNSLDYIETYVKEHRHLPNVPAASELVETGIDLGKMDATLLRQIEELWLTVIDLKKENESLRKQVDALEKK